MAQKPSTSLRRGSTVVYIVEGEGGEHRGYFGTALGHDGDWLCTKIKVAAGENFADGLVQNGVNYYTGPDSAGVPHGDETQGGTWIWPHEVPAGFYVG